MGEQDATGLVERPRRTLATLVPLTAWLPRYDWASDLRRDVVAGIAVAALLVPESMGYADVAGVPAEVGLYAALGSVLVYAVFGRTSILVVGPASAVAALSASVVAELGGGADAVAVTVALALLSGVLLVVAGALRLGWIVNFISRPVLHAFVSALSIAIIVGQLDGLLGIEVEGETALLELVDVLGSLDELVVLAASVGVVALVVLVALERLPMAVPAAVVVVVGGIVASGVLDLRGAGVGVAGAVPTGLPSLGVPDLAAMRWVDLVGGAAALLLVGFSEGYAAASAVAADTGEDIDADQELLASGAANIAAGLLGGLTVGGSLSKSAAGSAAGARTQVTNVVAGLLVLATLLFLAPVIQLLPEPVLAAVVIVAVLHAADPRRVLRVRRVNRLDFAAAAVTFTLVLVWEALPALLVGVLLSLAFLVHRATFPDVVQLRRGVDGTYRRDVPPSVAAEEVVVVRFEAPLLYANASRLVTAVNAVVDRNPGVRRVVIDAEMLADLDATGADTLERIDVRLAARDVEVVLARMHARARAQLDRSRLGNRFDGRTHATVEEAAAR